MKRRRIHIVFTTLLIGIFLWLSVTLREQFNVTVNAPLSIEDVPEGMAIRTAVPRHIQLKLRGEGWRLAGLLAGPDIHVNVPVHFAPAGKPDHHHQPDPRAHHAFPGHPGPPRRSRTPCRSGSTACPSKRVPVVPDISLTFREGYGQVGTAQLMPDSVTMIGAETVLRQIS